MSEEIKPGRSTTELGVTAFLAAMATFNDQLAGLTTPELFAVTAVAVAYILSRAWIKGKAASPAPLILGEPKKESET